MKKEWKTPLPLLSDLTYMAKYKYISTVWGKIIQHVDEFSKFYISRLHTITKYGPHINNSMKGLNI